MELEAIPFSLDQVFATLADNLAAKAQGKGLELMFDLPVDERLMGDP